jgi:hypothetical protein
MPKRSSAFFKAVGEKQETAENGETVAQQDSETVSPSDFSPVPPLNRETAQRLNLPTVEPSHREQEQSGSRKENTLLHRSTASPHSRETVKPSHGSTVTAELNKTSFYLTQIQLDKLDEMAYAYKRQTGKRINRNDIVRFLVDHARLETLLAEW